LTTTSDDPPRWRRHRRTVGKATILFLLLLVLAVWLGRQRIASHLANNYLADAGVPAAYRITRIGPFTQRIEDLRLGDPAHPDLTARRVDLGWRYGLTGPVLASVEADGVRLTGQWRNGRLSLGDIDRLMPRSSGSGGPALPDLRLAIRDAQAKLLTPAGAIDARVIGSGSLARDFRGNATVDAPRLAFGGCTLGRVAARLAIQVTNRSPHVQGPTTLAGADCVTRGLSVGAGNIRTNLVIAPALDAATGDIAIAGFAGRNGTTRFGAVQGAIGVAYTASDTHGRVDLKLAGLQTDMGRAAAASVAGDYHLLAAETHFDGAVGLRDVIARRDIASAATRGAQAAAGTPVGPVAARIGTAIGAMLTGSDIEAQIAYAGTKARQSVRIDQASIRSQRGEVMLSGSGASEGQGWTVDGHVSGGTLPSLAFGARQAGAKAPIVATVRMEPYATGDARLALAPLRIEVGADATRFATIATIDGPLGSGRIKGLTVPIGGRIGRNGELSVGEGCNPITFRQLRITSLTLDPGRIIVCGQPLVRRGADGAIHIAAVANDVTLHGRTGNAPVTLRAARLELAGTDAFTADALAVALGVENDGPTRLAIAKLDGRVTAQGLEGKFADAAGSIRNVPLALSGGAGTWRLDHGALHLAGAIGVADRATAPRFRPLTSGDVTLALVAGRIDAAASLRTPRFDKPVATVTLQHDLATGIGGAKLAVPGIAFVRDRFQPEMLTRLTEGVIANVTGIVSGDGRIDWTPSAVTSSGDFSTDRIDFAAAFGPVTGLSGKVHFTDLLGLVTAPHQEARIAQINPGVIVADGIAHYQLLGADRVQVEDAVWPFAGGTLTLDPTTLDFAQTAQRLLTFRIARLDAGAFIQQLDFPNISATGTFDGKLPMIFDMTGGRIEGGTLESKNGGTLAYVGELSNAALGTAGKLAFDALKAIRYSTLGISLDGRLDGEIVSRVTFQGVRQATGETSLAGRLIRNLPFRFNIQIHAPFRGLVGSAQAYINPASLLRTAVTPPAAADAPPAAIQPPESAPVR
jgi:translocation and assembly module TamB